MNKLHDYKGVDAEAELKNLDEEIKRITSAVPGVPTGTGFVHITGNVQDAVAKLVENADVSATAAIAESKLSLSYATHSNTNDPTADEKAALAGTSGTPGSGNKYVTNDDSRNTDARTPTSHATSHKNGGSDEVATATAAANAIPKAGSDGTLAAGWVVGLVPIGAIVAWHKSLTGCPALTSQFVECNGQTLSDADSPFNGQVIPNLNGDAGGADSPGYSSKEQMFLRGGTTSGTGQTDQMQGHFHARGWTAAGGSNYGPTVAASWANISMGTGGDQQTNYGIGKPVSDGTNGTPRTGTETRPKNMSVVWIMRIK